MILGCTHYPLIRGMLQRELGRDVTLVSAAEELAEEVAATLARKRLARDHGRRGSYRFACTGDAEAFASVGRRFLQLPDLERARARRRPSSPACRSRRLRAR